MEYEIFFGEAYCCCTVFEINNIDADYEDFGELKDLAPHLAEDYGCGNMTFIPKSPTKKVLDKYSINVEEYKKICEDLKEGLSFGKCRWCV